MFSSKTSPRSISSSSRVLSSLTSSPGRKYVRSHVHVSVCVCVFHTYISYNMPCLTHDIVFVNSLCVCYIIHMSNIICVVQIDLDNNKSNIYCVPQIEPNC